MVTKADHRVMREVNRSLVLDLLRSGGPLSRTDVAGLTELAKPTVSAIVDDLLADGTVREVGLGETTRQGGRPPSLLEFNERSLAYLGIDFGVHTTNVAVADGLGSICTIESAPSVQHRPERAVAQVRRLADKALAAAAFALKDVEVVSATVAGVVDRESGRVVLAPNLDWHDYPLRESLAGAFGKPASVHNVTHAAAVAEGAVGAAREARQFVWVYIGTGVGAGIMLDGQLFTGVRGFAGELGHCPVADDGPACACGGRGCLETVASAPAVVRIAEDACRKRRRTSLRDVEVLDAGAVVAAAREGDGVAVEILGTVGTHLGRGIAYLLNILNPGLIVVGGALAGAGDLLLGPVRQSVAEHALAATQTEIVGSVLGGRAEIIGAVRLAMNEQASSHRIVRRAFRPATS